ncbi:MAG: TrmB family transcriptional regulator [Ignavibacteria bacterium]
MNEEIIKNLEALGYTNYESRIFVALFTGNYMTTTEIAKSADIPRSSAYEILKDFTKQGICNEIETSSVVRYQLIDPKVVEDKIELEIHEAYKSKISKLKYFFDKLDPLFKQSEPPAEKIDVELIKGFNKHRNMKFLNLLQNAKKEVLLMIKLEMNVSPELDEAALNLYKSGGVIKSIYEASYDFKVKSKGEWKKVTPEGLLEVCRSFEEQGEKVKISEKIFQNMVIFDRKTVFVSLVDPTIAKYNRSDIIVNNENYANSMAEYFESCWNKSLTTEEFSKRVGTKNS